MRSKRHQCPTCIHTFINQFPYYLLLALKKPLHVGIRNAIHLYCIHSSTPSYLSLDFCLSLCSTTRPNTILHRQLQFSSVSKHWVVALWLLLICAWCRNRHKKPLTINTQALPATAFKSRDDANTQGVEDAHALVDSFMKMWNVSMCQLLTMAVVITCLIKWLNTPACKCSTPVMIRISFQLSIYMHASKCTHVNACLYFHACNCMF